ncbi:MAG: radical SAM protein [Bacteroidota bacterium]
MKAPIEAQLIVTRRCNLSCGYCAEYDNFSEPIPFGVLTERIDALHRLRVVNIVMLGGEPLMHPKIAEIVAYANHHSQVSITTNGFLLSDKLIERLNDVGLSNMQVSIDTLHADPTRYIQKSLNWIAPKLERLKRLARFDVHVTIVLCESSKDQFEETLDELRKFGFLVSVNLIHNEKGMVEIRGPEYLKLWDHHFEQRMPFSFIDYEYGKQLLQDQNPDWKCRAGARYLYVDEFGNVQFCASQRGRLNKPVTQYLYEDIREHSRTYKGCEQGCSVLCVYRDSQLDNAPLKMAKAMYQALRRGLLTGNHHKNDLTPQEIHDFRDPATQRSMEV